MITLVFVNIYNILLWAALIILSIYHIYKHEYKLIASTGAVFALTFLPGFFEKMCNIKMDLLGRILYLALIFMTVYLGSALKFYDKYRWWDRAIHFLSGIVFVSFGVAASKNAVELNRFHILLFSLTLSITLHVMWEVLEYTFDCWFNMDNQRWQKVNASNNHKPESAIQPAGLVDTMNDTIVCIAGTIISCIAWWFIL